MSSHDKAYVVVIDEYDYDSPNSDRLISCATFSSKEKAETYMKEKKLVEYDCVEGMCAYDEDGILAMRVRVIETEVDEFN